MIHTKRVIFMILPLLFVPLVYGISSTPDACALPPDPNWGTDSCFDADGEIDGMGKITCCWDEPDLYNPGEKVVWCQSCNVDETTIDRPKDCGPLFRSSSTGPLVLPDEGVVDEPTTPTPPPTSPLVRPPIGGVFDPPDLPQTPFRPPTGGVFDPPTVSPPTPPILSPPPPQDDGSGPLNPQGGGILQQPGEVENPEDEGENEEEEGSSEGAETAGPLT